MIWIDFVIIGIIFTYTIKGLLHGFRMELFALVSWLMATIVGLIFCNKFSVYLDQTISNTIPKLTTAFILLFLITLIVGSLIRMLLGTSIKKLKLRLIDHLGGIILSGARGMFLVVLLVMLAGLTHLPEDSWWKESRLLPSYQICAIWIRDHIPSALAEHIHYR